MILTEKQAAEKLMTNVETLKTWRAMGHGPSYLGDNDKAVYHLSDLTSYYNSTDEVLALNKNYEEAL